MRPEVTIITGASRGIGRFLAAHYLEQGHVVIGCSRGSSELEHKNYLHMPSDVADEDQVRNVCLDVRKKFGGIDNLINNAGIASMNHSLLTPGKVLSKLLATNVLGTFLFAREAAKIMRLRGRGRIVNFTTVAVPLKLEGESAYVASKAAVQGLTDVLAREFAPFGITVNAVGPVPIKTDLIKSVPSEKIDNLVQRQAIKRLGTFDDVTNVIDFFLSPRSEFVTGQIIYLGGI